MSDLIQLVYSSRSNTEFDASAVGVPQEIARILSASRRNNKRSQIGGVLCYGDGCFFQCLEGERGSVEKLYQTIANDNRHRDVTLLLSRSVHHRQFRLWAMKYLSVDRPIRQFLAEQGLKRFDPFALDGEAVDRLLEILRSDTEEWRRPGGNAVPERSAPASMSGGISPAMLGIGALAAALTVVTLIALVIL
ncbi:MAG: BLUF domain-containing protein [Wenzhouxiangella sp.]|nr:BLUF domain-containing protein [Wenzhouxiangella sp.]MCH8477027.1 BLUF domain-containing protein [Wenzhouxiangella sp.]